MTRSCLFYRRIRTFFIENNLHAKIYRFKWSKYQYTSQYIFVQTNEFTFNLAKRCRWFGHMPEQTCLLNLIAPYLKKILRYYILYSLLQRAYVMATIRTAIPVSVRNMKFLILMKFFPLLCVVLNNYVQCFFI